MYVCMYVCKGIILTKDRGGMGDTHFRERGGMCTSAIGGGGLLQLWGYEGEESQCSPQFPASIYQIVCDVHS